MLQYLVLSVSAQAQRFCAAIRFERGSDAAHVRLDLLTSFVPVESDRKKNKHITSSFQNKRCEKNLNIKYLLGTVCKKKISLVKMVDIMSSHAFCIHV